MSVSSSAYHVRQSGSGSTISALTTPSALAMSQGIQAEKNNYEIHRNEPSLLKVVTTTFTGNAGYQLPVFDLKLITGYQNSETRDAYYDFDQSAKDQVSFYTHNAYSRVTTAEFQISSNDGSWRADRFKWIGGAYYLHSLGGYDPITLEASGSGVPLGALDTLVNGLDIVPGPGGRVNIYGVLRTNSYSGFLQGDYSFTDWLNVTLGARGQFEDRFLTKQNVTSPDQSGGEPAMNGPETLLINYTEPKVIQRNFTPKLSFNFRPADGHLIYLSWARGFKSGTYNGINIYTAPTYVQPEIVDTYELGVKSDFLDGNLRLNAAIFQTSIKNPQVTFISLINGGAITFENAGAAKIKGAEADVLLVPLPNLNPGLVATLGGSFLHSIFTDYKNGSGFDDTTGVFFSKTGDFTGNRIPRSPRWSGTFGLNQSIEAPGGTVEVAANAYYNGGFFYNAQNTDVAKQKPYYLLDAHAGYLYEAWKLRLTVFGQNLNNRVYSYSAFTADYGTALTLAPPRSYGLRLNWEF